MIQIPQDLKPHVLTIVLVALAAGVLSMAASFAFRLEYRADAELLVIAPTEPGGDTYAAAKSAERIGENLAQVLETNDFFQKVTAQTMFQLDQTRFENVNERVKRKRWQKAIDGTVVYGTSVLRLSVYHADQAQAERFTAAAAAALVRFGSEYAGSAVNIKIVNDPVATRFPARPNILVNGLVGLLAGAALGIVLAIRRKSRWHI